MKKIIISIIIISTIISAGIYIKDLKRGYTLLTTDLSTGAGFAPSTPNPKSAREADEVNILIKSLPLSTTGFSITNYNYATGKFLVKNFYIGSDLEAEFTNWQKTSSYSAIPRSMFLLQQ